jgi:MFS family permease
MTNTDDSYYLGDMLTQAGITSTTTQLQINTILNCWAFTLAVIGSFLTDVAGRKTMAIIGLVGMICSLYIFGGLTKGTYPFPKSRRNTTKNIFTAYGTSDNHPAIYGTIAILFIFQGFYAVSFTPMTTVYPTEVLSFKIRTAGISLFRILTSSFG